MNIVLILINAYTYCWNAIIEFIYAYYLYEGIIYIYMIFINHFSIRSLLF